LSYDITIVQDNQQGKPLSAKQWACVTVPTLVMVGGKSPASSLLLDERNGLRPANFEAMKRVYASVESQAEGSQSRLQCIHSKIS
jgi:hypothetical protein